MTDPNAVLREALAFYADDANWRQNGPLDPNSANFTGGPARAALAAAPQPAPAPAGERAEIERIICDAFTCDLRGRGDEDGAFWQTAADALLAAGWTRGGDASALARPSAPVVCHKTASGDTQAPLPVTDDAQADPETPSDDYERELVDRAYASVERHMRSAERQSEAWNDYYARWWMPLPEPPAALDTPKGGRDE